MGLWDVMGPVLWEFPLTGRAALWDHDDKRRFCFRTWLYGLPACGLQLMIRHELVYCLVQNCITYHLETFWAPGKCETRPTSNHVRKLAQWFVLTKERIVVFCHATSCIYASHATPDLTPMHKERSEWKDKAIGCRFHICKKWDLMALREFLATGSLQNFQVFSELPAAEVCATLQVRIPAGYPTSATPKVFVERSRGIGDVPRHDSSCLGLRRGPKWKCWTGGSPKTEADCKKNEGVTMSFILWSKVLFALYILYSIICIHIRRAEHILPNFWPTTCWASEISWNISKYAIFWPSHGMKLFTPPCHLQRISLGAGWTPFPSPQRCRSLQKPWWKQHLVSRWFVFQDLPDDHPSGSLSTLMWVVCLDSVCYNSPLRSPRERLYNAASRTSMNIYEQLVMAQHVAFRIVSSCHHLGEYNNPATIRLVFHDPPWAIFCFH